MADEELPKAVPFNPALLKTVFDWLWKAGIVIGLIAQFYSNQDKKTRDLSEMETRMAAVETTVNQLNRELSDARGDIKALTAQLQSDRDYYMQTRKR
jgi:flagellar motility protein MotE (MotC chaperone)